jgi:PBP1b-binding outer membrane lipoprotein LpoB
MEKNMNKFKIILFSVICIFLLNGCNEGPAETKGKKIDNKIQEVKDKIQNKGPAQKLGEKIDDKTN